MNKNIPTSLQVYFFLVYHEVSRPIYGHLGGFVFALLLTAYF